jgi:hypothetical protein
MSGNYEPGTVVSLQRSVQDRFGELTDADFLPVGYLVRNGIETAEVVTVLNTGTGKYKVTFTIPGTWAIKDTVELFLTATVDGTSGGACVWSAVLYAVLIAGPLAIAVQSSLNVPFPTTLSVFKKSASTLAITVIDNLGVVVNLSGKTLKFRVESSATTPVELFTQASVTISGTSNEIASIALTTTHTDKTPSTYKWRLWDQNSVVLGHGDFVILPSIGAS